MILGSFDNVYSVVNGFTCGEMLCCIVSFVFINFIKTKRALKRLRFPLPLQHKVMFSARAHMYYDILLCAALIWIGCAAKRVAESNDRATTIAQGARLHAWPKPTEGETTITLGARTNHAAEGDNSETLFPMERGDTRGQSQTSKTHHIQIESYRLGLIDTQFGGM